MMEIQDICLSIYIIIFRSLYFCERGVFVFSI